MAFDGVDYSIMRSYLQRDINNQFASHNRAINQANNYGNQQAVRANQYQSLSNHLFSRVQELNEEKYNLQVEKNRIYDLYSENFDTKLAYRTMMVSLIMSSLMRANFSEEEIDNRDYTRLWGDMPADEIKQRLDNVFKRGLYHSEVLMTGHLKHPRTKEMFEDRENNKEKYLKHLGKNWLASNNEFIPTKETFIVVTQAIFSGFYNSGLPLDIDCGEDILKTVYSPWGL